VANNRFKIDGLFELKAQLRDLPKALQAEGGAIVLDTADQAAGDLQTLYPVRTTGLSPGPSRTSAWAPPGDLRSHVFVSKRGGQFSTMATVKSTGKAAWLYDNGSQARKWVNGKLTGAMPATHLFVKTMMRWRRVMYHRLGDLLERHGLVVRGIANP
jgi:hypothetical protein